MIAYSSVSLAHISMELVKTNCKVKVFIYDPRKVTDPWQVNRITEACEQIKKEFEDEKKTQNLEILFYDTPASLRGINFDNNYVATGWYVFYNRKDGSKIITDMRGHTQPSIGTHTSTNEGQKILKLFNDQFQRLDESKIEGSIVDNWLKNRKATD